MERVKYGKTGIQVSRLCIGCGHFTRVYPNVEDGGKFLLKVLERGVTFWDTAESYGSHPHIGAALKHIDRTHVVIQTKTGNKDYESAKKSIQQALKVMGTNYLDIILLHGVQSPEDLKSRQGALKAMLEAKEQGKVRAVGCSTHIWTGAVMDAVIDCPDIEVILCTVNKGGWLLEGGTMERHIEYVKQAYKLGKGISIMKIVAGGDTKKVPEDAREDAIRWAFQFPWAHAVNLGICTKPELELDVRIAEEQVKP